MNFIQENHQFSVIPNPKKEWRSIKSVCEMLP